MYGITMSERKIQRWITTIIQMINVIAEFNIQCVANVIMRQNGA